MKTRSWDEQMAKAALNEAMYVWKCALRSPWLASATKAMVIYTHTH